MSFDPNKLDQFPSLPGVYLMKNQDNEVLYIGKAKNLRKRIKQYFIPGRDGRVMVPYLIAKIHSVEPIVVTSEKEALLLESNLIKQHQPHYNALLKDDKSYVALKINMNEQWPAVRLVRYRGTPEPDGIYFGPYTSAFAARQTLDLLQRLFPLRRCSDAEFSRRNRPCLLYQMHRCAGPCGGKCSEVEYQQHLKRTIQFLRGQDKEILQELYTEMQEHSLNLEFEQAAHIHRMIQQIEKTIEEQYVDKPLGVNADAIALFRQADEALVSQFTFRHGRLVSSRQFNFKNFLEDDRELLTSFLIQRYGEAEELPSLILIPISLPNHHVIEEIISKGRHQQVSIHYPQRGEKKILVNMAKSNAEALFNSQKNIENQNEKCLLELKESLNLTNYPTHIECIDNSHTSGGEPVAALVAFINGIKDTKRYRTYGLKHQGKASDDYASMYEVLLRRYKRAKEENDLPDLLIVDGGKGQLGIALKVFSELNVIGVDIVGVAKEEGRHDKGMTAEQLFLPDQSSPIHLNTHSPALFLIQNIRDEAHRFVLNFHRKRRTKKSLKSSLEEIKGIGPTKRKKLITHFGSVKKLAQATDEDLKQVQGISKTDRKILLEYFQSKSSS